MRLTSMCPMWDMQPMEMRYSYWDGTGHGYTLVVRKGDTIGKFLQAAKEQLGQNFRWGTLHGAALHGLTEALRCQSDLD